MSELRKITVSNGTEFTFVNEADSNRSGFYHKSELFRNGRNINTNKVQYYNRTWECYRFQTSMKGCVYELITERTESLLKAFKEQNGYSKLTAKRKAEFEASEGFTDDTSLTEYRELYKKLDSMY